MRGATEAAPLIHRRHARQAPNPALLHLVQGLFGIIMEVELCFHT